MNIEKHSDTLYFCDDPDCAIVKLDKIFSGDDGWVVINKNAHILCGPGSKELCFDYVNGDINE